MAASDPIRIKRYPNRRFYASEGRTYVSLKEIESKIREGRTVEIVDSQTGHDITRAVLAQIIIEHHPDKMALFPSAMLHSILQANDVMAEFLRDYFRQCLGYLDHLRGNQTPPALTHSAQWMKSWFDSLQPTHAPAQDTGKTAAPPGSELAGRLAELESRLADLEARRKSTRQSLSKKRSR